MARPKNGGEERFEDVRQTLLRQLRELRTLIESAKTDRERSQARRRYEELAQKYNDLDGEERE